MAAIPVIAEIWRRLESLVNMDGRGLTDTNPGDRDVPSEQVLELRRIRRLLGLLLTLGLLVACVFAKDLLLPLILGLMLALTLSPVVRIGSRIGIAPPVTAIVVITSLAIGMVGIGYMASGPVGMWLRDAPQLGERLQERLSGLSASVEQMQEATKEVEKLAEQASGGGTQRVQIAEPGLLNFAVANMATIGGTIVVAFILALFVLASGQMFYAKLVESFPRLSDKKRALKIVYGVEEAISRYLLTITLINAGLGLVIWGLMMAVGLPNAFIWGLVAFSFNFLPILGAIAGTLLVAVYAIITFDTLTFALLAPALYFTATSIEGQLVTPTILGHSLEMNTTSVFVTVIVWAWLWGVPGALIAVPFLVIVKVICDNVSGWQAVGNFLGSASTKVPLSEADASAQKA